MKKLPVVAAIPAYNTECALPTLLNQVLEQEYDSIYILDDASTDNTVEAAMAYGPDINLIAEAENVGAGANRNRILEHLGGSAIIHFIDSDVELNSADSPLKARELVNSDDIAFVSGLVRLADGTQNPWNYGPAFSLPQMVSAWIHSGIYKLGQSRPEVASTIRERLEGWTLIEQWPNTLQPPVARDVYWGSEANMVIPSEVFRTVGGYDPRLRYHEVMELAMRLDKLGLRRRFDPLIDVTHQSFDLMNNGTSKEFYDAQMKIVRKMGLKKFLFPKLLETID